MPRLIGKSDILKKEITISKNGEDQYGNEHNYSLTFGPNHYGLPVSESVYNKAEVGKHYEFDIVESK